MGTPTRGAGAAKERALPGVRATHSHASRDHPMSTMPDPQTPPELPSVPPPGHGAPAPVGPAEIDAPGPAENPVPVHEIPGMPPTTA